MKKYNYGKIMHWLFALCFLVLGFTAIMNTTFYSKEAIMQSFEFSLPMVELYDVAESDKLFIARIERRDSWVFHFWVGILAFVLTTIRLYAVRKKKKELLTKIFYIAFITIFITGLPLYLRTFIDIEQSIIDIARTVHYYSAWVLALYCVIHIFKVIYRENKYKTNKISNMFIFTKKLMLVILFSSFFTTCNLEALEIDKFYNEGIQYKEGIKGGLTVEKVMPNCPYEYCKKAEEMKKRMNVEIVDDKQTFKILKKDLKTALILFQKSSKEFNNPKSVQNIIKIVLKKVNYKDKKLNEMLIHKMKEDLGLTVSEYKRIIKTNLLKAYDFKQCRGSFYYAQFIENGYQDIFNSSTDDEVKEVYTNVVKYCSNIPFIKMQAMAKSK